MDAPSRPLAPVFTWTLARCSTEIWQWIIMGWRLWMLWSSSSVLFSTQQHDTSELHSPQEASHIWKLRGEIGLSIFSCLGYHKQGYCNLSKSVSEAKGLPLLPAKICKTTHYNLQIFNKFSVKQLLHLNLTWAKDEYSCFRMCVCTLSDGCEPLCDLSLGLPDDCWRPDAAEGGCQASERHLSQPRLPAAAPWPGHEPGTREEEKEADSGSVETFRHMS